MSTILQTNSQMLKPIGNKYIQSSFKLSLSCCMCLIQSNKYQTMSFCCYLNPFKSVQDFISTQRDQIRIKATIAFYKVKI